MTLMRKRIIMPLYPQLMELERAVTVHQISRGCTQDAFLKYEF